MSPLAALVLLTCLTVFLVLFGLFLISHCLLITIVIVLLSIATVTTMNGIAEQLKIKHRIY